jgi:hypothetical protein
MDLKCIQIVKILFTFWARVLLWWLSTWGRGWSSHICLKLYVVEYLKIDSMTIGCINPLRTDGDFCHQGRDTEIAPNISKWLQPIDMTIKFVNLMNLLKWAPHAYQCTLWLPTIHWKDLKEHFLIIPIVS